MAEEGPVPKRVSMNTVLSEPELPLELLTGPQVPDGLGVGWYLVHSPLSFFARVLTDKEADDIRRLAYPEPGHPDHRPSMAHVATIYELTVQNLGDKPFQPTDRQRFKVSLVSFDDLFHPFEQVNHNMRTTAEEKLGKDHELCVALNDDLRPTIPPGKSIRTLHVFTDWSLNKSVVPEMISKVYVDDRPLWPTYKRVPPPGMKVAAEGLIEFYLTKPDKHQQRYEELGPLHFDKGLRLEAVNEWGERIDFLTDGPIDTTTSDEVAFARVTAETTGDIGFVPAGAIGGISSRVHGLDSATNPLPTWDPRQGPPEGPFRSSHVRRRWLVTIACDRPMVAAGGDTYAVAIENRMWVFDQRGETKHAFETDWYPYSLCFARGADSIYMGRENTVMEFDLYHKSFAPLQDLPARIESMAVSCDGSIMALSDTGLLMHMDVEGRITRTMEVKAYHKVYCAAKADANLLWDGYAVVEVLDSEGTNLVRKPHEPVNLSGVAISPDGRTLALGRSDYKVALLDVESGQVKAVWPTISNPNALAFHPDRPLLLVGTGDSYLHVFHLEHGSLFTKKLEGYVAHDMAFGDKACIFSTMDGYVHLLEPEAR